MSQTSLPLIKLNLVQHYNFYFPDRFFYEFSSIICEIVLVMTIFHIYFWKLLVKYFILPIKNSLVMIINVYQVIRIVYPTLSNWD